MLAGFRPEHVRLEGDPVELHGTVVHVESTGSTTFLKLLVASHPVVVTLTQRFGVAVGDRLRLGFEAADLHVFDRDSEANVLAPGGDAPRKAA